MGKCFVQNCKSIAGKTPGVSFHVFPFNSLIKQKWLKRIKRTDGFLPGNHHKVCSLHFKEGCINQTTQIQKLLPGSFPSIFPRRMKASQNRKAAAVSQDGHLSDKPSQAKVASEKMVSTKQPSSSLSQHSRKSVSKTPTSRSSSNNVKRSSSSLSQKSGKSVNKTPCSSSSNNAKRPSSSLSQQRRKSVSKTPTPRSSSNNVKRFSSSLSQKIGKSVNKTPRSSSNNAKHPSSSLSQHSCKSVSKASSSSSSNVKRSSSSLSQQRRKSVSKTPTPRSSSNNVKRSSSSLSQHSCKSVNKASSSSINNVKRSSSSLSQQSRKSVSKTPTPRSSSNNVKRSSSSLSQHSCKSVSKASSSSSSNVKRSSSSLSQQRRKSVSKTPTPRSSSNNVKRSSSSLSQHSCKSVSKASSSSSNNVKRSSSSLSQQRRKSVSKTPTPRSSSNNVKRSSSSLSQHSCKSVSKASSSSSSNVKRSSSSLSQQRRKSVSKTPTPRSSSNNVKRSSSSLSQKIEKSVNKTPRSSSSNVKRSSSSLSQQRRKSVSKTPTPRSSSNNVKHSSSSLSQHSCKSVSKASSRGSNNVKRSSSSLSQYSGKSVNKTPHSRDSTKRLSSSLSQKSHKNDIKGNNASRPSSSLSRYSRKSVNKTSSSSNNNAKRPSSSLSQFSRENDIKGNNARRPSSSLSQYSRKSVSKNPPTNSNNAKRPLRSLSQYRGKSDNSSDNTKRPSGSLSQHCRKRSQSFLSHYAGFKITDNLDKTVNLNPVVYLDKLEDNYDMKPVINFDTDNYCEGLIKKRKISSPKGNTSQSKLLTDHVKKKTIVTRRDDKPLGTRNSPKGFNKQPPANSLFENDTKKKVNKPKSTSTYQDLDFSLENILISGVCSLASTETINGVEESFEITLTKEEVEFFKRTNVYELVSDGDDQNNFSEEIDNEGEDVKPSISSTIDISDVEYSDDDVELKNYPDYYDTTEMLSDFEFEEDESAAPQSPELDTKSIPDLSSTVWIPPYVESQNQSSSANTFSKEDSAQIKNTNLQSTGTESGNLLEESAEIQQKMLKIPREIIQALPSSLSIIFKPRKKMEKETRDDREVLQNEGLIIIPRPVAHKNVPKSASAVETVSTLKPTPKEKVPEILVEESKRELIYLPRQKESKKILVNSSKSTLPKVKTTPESPNDKKLNIFFKEKSMLPQLDDHSIVLMPSSKDKKTVKLVQTPDEFSSSLNQDSMIVECLPEPTTSLQLASHNIPEKTSESLEASCVEPSNKTEAAPSEENVSTKFVNKPAPQVLPVSMKQDALQGKFCIKEASSSTVLPPSSVMEKPPMANECVKPLQGPSQSIQGGVARKQLVTLPRTMNLIRILRPVTPSTSVQANNSSAPHAIVMRTENSAAPLNRPIIVHRKDENVVVCPYDPTAPMRGPTTVAAVATRIAVPPLLPLPSKVKPQATICVPTQHVKTSTMHHVSPTSKTLPHGVPYIPISKKTTVNKNIIQVKLPSAKNSLLIPKPQTNPPSLKTLTIVVKSSEITSNTSMPANTASAPQQRKRSISLSKVSQLPHLFKTVPNSTTTTQVLSPPVAKTILIKPSSSLKSPLKVHYSHENNKFVSSAKTPLLQSPKELILTNVAATINWKCLKNNATGVSTSSPCLPPCASQAATVPTTEVPSQEATPSKGSLQATASSTSTSQLPTDVATPTSQQTKKLPSPVLGGNDEDLEIIKEVIPPRTPCASLSSSKEKMPDLPADGLVSYDRLMLLSLLLGERAASREFTLELKRKAGRLDQMRISYPSSDIPPVNLLVRCGTNVVTYISLFYGADPKDPMQECELFRSFQELNSPKTDRFMVVTNRFVGQSLSSVLVEWTGTPDATLGGLRLPLFCLKKDFEGQDNVLARLCGPQGSGTLKVQAQTFLNTICFAVAQTEAVLDRNLQGKLETEFFKQEQAKKVLIKLLEWTTQYVGKYKSGDISISSSDFNDVLRDMKIKLKVNFQLLPPISYFFARDLDLLKADQILKKLKVRKEIFDLVVCGLAGVGKTEFVRYFLQLHEHVYSSVIVVNAESRESLQLSLQKAARHFKIDTNTEAPIDRQACRELASKILEYFTDKKALIVFDNVDTTECIQNIDFILAKNINNTNITVIVTSRYMSWDNAISVKLDVLEKEEAKLFLRQNIASDEIDDDDIDDDNDELIESLAEQLSHHPFALQIAVACINREVEALKIIGDKLALQKKIKGYLNQNKKPKENFNISPDDRKAEACLASLITAWQRTKISIMNEKYGEIALKIFEIMSYMATEEIDLEVFLLLKDITELSDEEDSDDEDEGDDAQRVLCTAMSVLSNYCLLEAQGGKARVHRLLQQVVRTNLRDVEHREKEVLDAVLSMAVEDNKKNERNYDLSSTNFSKPLLFYWIEIMNHSVNYIDTLIKYSNLIPKLMRDLFSSNGCKDKIIFTCALFQTIIGLLQCSLKKSSTANYSKILTAILDSKLQLARFLWLERNDSSSAQVYLQVHTSLVKNLSNNPAAYWHAEAFKGYFHLERLHNNRQQSDAKNSKKSIVHNLINVIKNLKLIITNHFGSLIMLERIAFYLSGTNEWKIHSIKIYTELLAKRAKLRESDYLTPSPVESILNLLPTLNNCLWVKLQRPECLRLLRLCLEEALLCRDGQVTSFITYLKYVSVSQDKKLLDENLSEQLLDRLVDGDITFSFVFYLGMCLNQAEDYSLEVKMFEKVIEKNKFGESEHEVLQLMVALTSSLINKKSFVFTLQEFDKVLKNVKWEHLDWMGKTMRKMECCDFVCKIVDKLWSKPQDNVAIAFWHSQLVAQLKKFGDQLLDSGKKLEALRIYQETFDKLARVASEIGNEKYKYPEDTSPEAFKTLLENEFYVL